jgi:hypothetical protein
MTGALGTHHTVDHLAAHVDAPLPAPGLRGRSGAPKNSRLPRQVSREAASHALGAKKDPHNLHDELQQAECETYDASAAAA